MALARMNPEANVGRMRSGSVDVRASGVASWRALGLTREGMAAVVPAWWSIGVPAAVASLIVAGSLLQPAPAEDATGTAAVMESVIANVLFVGLVASVVGAMSLRRWGMGAALGTALFTTGLVVSCPATGHHTFGLWFAGQSACVFAATGLAAWGLVRTRG
jgi:anti-sigma factor RsiW